MITTCVTEDGRIVLPDSVVRELGIWSGDAVDVEVEGNRVFITPQSPRPPLGEARIIRDPITGMPALTRGPGSAIMTHEQVKELLVDFP